MDDKKKTAILADLSDACRAVVAAKSAEYTALAVDPQLRGGGLLGGGGQKVTADGKPAFPPWESTELKALGLSPSIAKPIARKHGVAYPDVLELGAWKLSNDNSAAMWRGSGASDFLSRMAIANAAAYERAMEGWQQTLADDIAITENRIDQEKKRRAADENDRARKRETMRNKVQPKGAQALAVKKSESDDLLVNLFNEERRKQPRLSDTAIRKNVAVELERRGIKTLKGNAHTPESIRRALALHRARLNRQIF